MENRRVGIGSACDLRMCRDEPSRSFTLLVAPRKQCPHVDMRAQIGGNRSASIRRKMFLQPRHLQGVSKRVPIGEQQPYPSTMLHDLIEGRACCKRSLSNCFAHWCQRSLQFTELALEGALRP